LVGTPRCGVRAAFSGATNYGFVLIVILILD
jgi:hypothetical protein